MNLWTRILIAMKVSYVRQHVALAALMACASLVALSAGAIEWSMLIEVDGATNKVTSADKRYAIDVSLVVRDGAWSGSVANREKALMKSDSWRANRDYLRCVSDFRRKHGALLLGGTFKADEGFSVKGGRKIVANRWEDANGETGILVWNADDKPAKVSVAFGGVLLSASEPERGEVNAADPIPPNSLRLYRYKVSDAKGLNAKQVANPS